jgi:endoglucanase
VTPPATAPSGGPSGNPFAGAAWYIDPDSKARLQAETWRSSRPADAAQMDKIAAQPVADWLDNPPSSIRAVVSARVDTITAANALPILVAYYIPKRDCLGEGASSASVYQAWIRAFADGIGNRPAVVILEPDALANITCVSATDQQTRIDLIRDAITVLEAKPGVAVYVDAGHPNWVSASTMSDRLRNVGIENAQGFALNVSSFGGASDNIAYGRELSALIGDKHFIIDTSRNGLGPSPDGRWCNPPGRALGPRPTTATADALVDAYLWIKPPGESDGTCNGGPVAGIWWPEYSLGLAQRASY